jgi:hypothetical protein
VFYLYVSRKHEFFSYQEGEMDLLKNVEEYCAKSKLDEKLIRGCLNQIKNTLVEKICKKMLEQRKSASWTLKVL